MRAGIPVLAGLTPFPFYSTAVTRSLAAIRLSSAAMSSSSWPGRKAIVPFRCPHLFAIGSKAVSFISELRKSVRKQR